MAADTEHQKAEKHFTFIWVGCCVVVGLLLGAFVFGTWAKAVQSPQDITADWFTAWGAWAGGVATAAAFLIATGSIKVTSAHARDDRRAAADTAAADAMAQARLLTIRQTETTYVPLTMAMFWLENRSKESFFDVEIPYVDRVHDGKQERVVGPRYGSSIGRIRSYDWLAPYRSEAKNSQWSFEIRVVTDERQPVTFVVNYTDSAGRAWQQHSNGELTRRTVTNTAASRLSSGAVTPNATPPRCGDPS
ncbi:hypothetical protein [Nocardia goodfellowii]|uniref:Uncharacterized protein n=1 Tax=Nocardia goodfellowii TaxID=882446 RepID=A0ABS4QR17_9NOCA|nr:hypothetical protein [Nocardia goodfellowii]MBP2193610.1 hypothetical protein [Nocardia goodfellowii]